VERVWVPAATGSRYGPVSQLETRGFDLVLGSVYLGQPLKTRQWTPMSHGESLAVSAWPMMLISTVRRLGSPGCGRLRLPSPSLSDSLGDLLTRHLLGDQVALTTRSRL
jgi:hypothetical protein